MSTGNAKAIGYLELNIDGFAAALDQAKKLLAVFGVSFAAFKTADFWVGHIKGAIDFGDAMYVASQKLGGFDPGKLLLVQKAIQATGISAEEANSQISEMLAQHRDFSTYFRQGESGFGKALGEAQQDYGGEADVLSKHAEEFSRISQMITAIYNKGQDFFVQMASQFVKPLYSLLDEIDKVDLASVGARLGKYITDAIDTVRGLITDKTLYVALQTGFQVAANYLLGGINSALDLLTNADMWKNLGKALLDTMAVVGVFLTNVILGIGKLLVASVEAALAQIHNKYAPEVAILTHPVETAAMTAVAKARGVKLPIEALPGYNEYGMGGYSTDVAKNLDNINKSPLVAAQKSGAGTLIADETAKAITGFGKAGKDLQDVAKNFKPADLYTGKNGKPLTLDDLAKILDTARAAGARLESAIPPKIQGNPGITSDPIKVIADSLARVGGGGNYIRSGLSIAEKEAMAQTEAVRQSNTVLHVIAKNTDPKNQKGGQDPKVNRG